MTSTQERFAGTYLQPTKYLSFERVDNPGRKTMVWNVISQSSEIVLGRIAWYGPWRQYCFYPSNGTIFNTDCLIAIADRLETCNRWQRNIRENLAAAGVA